MNNKFVFTQDHINKLFNSVKNKVTGRSVVIRINKCGNIDFKFVNNTDGEHFVLYIVNNGKNFLWRRHVIGSYGYWNQYPLNMIGRKIDKEYTEKCRSNYYCSDTYIYRPYTISNSYFNSFDEAIDYFIHYLNDLKRTW